MKALKAAARALFRGFVKKYILKFIFSAKKIGVASTKKINVINNRNFGGQSKKTTDFEKSSPTFTKKVVLKVIETENILQDCELFFQMKIKQS
jgi:hypothetical protein